MLEMQIQHGGRRITPDALPTILGAERAYLELGDMVEALIAQMDLLAGDPDIEPNGDEHGDPAYPEWHTMRGASKGLPMPPGMPHEDDEEDDAAEEDDSDSAVDDRPCDDDFDREDAAEYDAPFLAYNEDQTEPLPWAPIDDLRAHKAHRERIRRTRATITNGAWGIRFDLPWRCQPVITASELAH